jgi:hypothetical protein
MHEEMTIEAGEQLEQALRLFALRQLPGPSEQPLNALHGVFDASKGSAVGQSAYEF